MSEQNTPENGAFFCDSFGFKKVDFDESLTYKPDDLLRILYVEPHKPAVVAEMDRGLSAIQRAVKGCFEQVYMDDNTVVLCNEEGKLNGMDGNRRKQRLVVFLFYRYTFKCQQYGICLSRYGGTLGQGVEFKRLGCGKRRIYQQCRRYTATDTGGVSYCQVRKPGNSYYELYTPISSVSEDAEIVLRRDGEVIRYTLGETLTKDGEYTATVKDRAGNFVEYSFTISPDMTWIILTSVVVGLFVAVGITVFVIIKRKQS